MGTVRQSGVNFVAESGRFDVPIEMTDRGLCVTVSIFGMEAVKAELPL
jgi:hypothetical protein